MGISMLRNVHFDHNYVQKKDCPSCRVMSVCIGSKHSIGAIPNFPLFTAVASIVMETYNSLRTAEFFSSLISAAAYQ